MLQRSVAGRRGPSNWRLSRPGGGVRARRLCVESGHASEHRLCMRARAHGVGKRVGFWLRQGAANRGSWSLRVGPGVHHHIMDLGHSCAHDAPSRWHAT